MAGANVNDASKGKGCGGAERTRRTPAGVLHRGRRRHGGARLGASRHVSRDPHARALRLARRRADAGVFADVVDVEDTVQISLAPVAEKARSFTS